MTRDCAKVTVSMTKTNTAKASLRTTWLWTNNKHGKKK